MGRPSRRTVFTVAATLAGVSLLAAGTVFLLEVVSAILHLGIAFIYAFSGGIS